jgi:hypothetical protein
MDDELHQLETELKRLRPSAPSQELLRRIDDELRIEIPGRPLLPIRWLWLAALPAAAAFAIVFFQRSPNPSSHPMAHDQTRGASRIPPQGAANAEAPFKPVAAENVLVSASDEGLVTLDDGTQARRERLRYVDTITWKNPRTNASLIWSVPREEVRVVPVAFQ